MGQSGIAALVTPLHHLAARSAQRRTPHTVTRDSQVAVSVQQDGGRGQGPSGRGHFAVARIAPLNQSWPWPPAPPYAPIKSLT